MTLLNIKLSNGTKRLVKYKAPTKGTVVIGGRTYPTVKIGNQLWLAENLDYKFEVYGSQITIGASGTPSTPTAWYYDNNETSYGIDGTYKCGLLYNWYATKYLNDNKSTLLPEGWHVPSVIEWDNLANEIGGVDTAGAKLKAKNNTVTSDWPSNWNGTDDYGFAALPTGYYNGSFDFLGSYSYFLTPIEYSSQSAYYIFLGAGTSLRTDENYKTSGYPIRLVKDAA